MKTFIIYTLFLVSIINASAVSAQNAAPKALLRGSSTEIIALEDYVKDNAAHGLKRDELIKENNLLQCNQDGEDCKYNSDCCAGLECYSLEGPFGPYFTCNYPLHRGSSTEIIAFKDYVKDNAAQELNEENVESNGDELIKEDNMLQCKEDGYQCNPHAPECCGGLQCSSVEGPPGYYFTCNYPSRRVSSTEIIAFENYAKDNAAQELIEDGYGGDGDELIKEDNFLQCNQYGEACKYDTDCCGDLQCYSLEGPSGLYFKCEL